MVSAGWLDIQMPIMDYRCGLDTNKRENTFHYILMFLGLSFFSTIIQGNLQLPEKPNSVSHHCSWRMPLDYD